VWNAGRKFQGEPSIALNVVQNKFNVNYFGSANQSIQPIATLRLISTLAAPTNTLKYDQPQKTNLY